MEYVDHVLSKQEIETFIKRYAPYAKVTVDIEQDILVIGCELHADGEEILLEKGSKQEDIWGGGINFGYKEVDATAVLNLRPSSGNSSIEILDSKRREKFMSVVKKIFANIWQS